ncbi:glutamate carboxypeptidase 2-like [Nilaparvata lugens]|uniref:glutamate carboxypeptidase 2-like n=1 Tax=Nilaparvata lugens TaxID=108931 RepID=UPI00193E0672|nr:glutamate carboxypeptidase 2-like [Nilaparvata lugens]
MQHVLSFPPQERYSAGEVVTKRLCCSFLLTIAFVALVLGYLLGRYSPNKQLQNRMGAYKVEVAKRIKYHNDAAEFLEHRILAERILQYHQDLMSQELHDKNGSVNYYQALKLKEHFEKNGFDVTTPPLPVSVILTYYDQHAPNQVSVINSVNNAAKVTAMSLPMSANLRENLQRDSTSVSKITEGGLVYANYGSTADFLHLTSMSIPVLNNVVIIRIKYITTVFDAISRAVKAGASAVILFSDPLHTEDDIQFLSPALLGRLHATFSGKINSNECFPVHVIRASDAENIINEMASDHPSPSFWRGKLKSKYSIGPGFFDKNLKLQIVTNVVNVKHTFYNVISGIRGREEPDRYVILGSNREMLMETDADRLGSTAAMMELTRVFGQLRSTKGWVPRRSVLFCSWGLQGDGHFNSEIWAQHYANLLKERAVAYVSMETAVTGNEHLKVQAVPLLEKAVRDASALVPNPNRVEILSGHKTILDSWTRYSQTKYNTSLQVYLGYIGSQVYEDKNFTVHRAVTELWALLVWTLSDSSVLPFRVTDYARFLQKSIDSINSTHQKTLLENNITLDALQEAIKEFLSVAESFDSELKEIDQTNLLKLRIANDKLVHLEKTLVCSSQYARHKVLWKGASDYTGFGQLHIELEELTSVGDASQVVQHISILANCLHSAGLLLQDSLRAVTTGDSVFNNRT